MLNLLEERAMRDRTPVAAQVADSDPIHVPL